MLEIAFREAYSSFSFLPSCSSFWFYHFQAGSTFTLLLFCSNCSSDAFFPYIVYIYMVSFLPFFFHSSSVSISSGEYDADSTAAYWQAWNLPPGLHVYSQIGEREVGNGKSFFSSSETNEVFMRVGFIGVCFSFFLCQEF